MKYFKIPATAKVHSGDIKYTIIEMRKVKQLLCEEHIEIEHVRIYNIWNI